MEGEINKDILKMFEEQYSIIDKEFFIKDVVRTLRRMEERLEEIKVKE